MKKYLIAVLGLSLSMVAWADPRIEVNDDGSVCHIPLSHVDENDEAKIGAPICEAVAIEVNDKGYGACKCEWEGVIPQVLEDIDWNVTTWKPDQGLILKAKYKYPYPGLCKIVADGNEYDSDNWKSKLKYFVDQDRLVVKMYCLDGVLPI